MTFDILLRLAYGDSIYYSISKNIQTEYTENKFYYSLPKVDKGSANQSGYLLRYENLKIISAYNFRYRSVGNKSEKSIIKYANHNNFDYEIYKNVYFERPLFWLKIKLLIENLKKKEYEYLRSKVIKKPTISEFYDLVNSLEKYYQLTWTYKQIMQGYKIIRKKKFYLKDTLSNYSNKTSFCRNPIIFNYIILFKNIYLNLEKTLIFSYCKKDFYIIKDKEIKNIKYINENFNLLNEYLISEKNSKLRGLCKNIPKNKFFKMFKRLRSLITLAYFDTNNNKNKTTLKLIRDEMNKILQQKYNILSQFKNRANILLYLKKKHINNNFNLLYNEFVDDLKTSFKNRNINISFDLDNLEKNISNYLNNISKSIFLSYYNRTKKILNITIPELDTIYLEKAVSFKDALMCRSYILANKKSNKKYKNFKSYFQYALDWSQCKELIPMNDKVIENTLMYMFNKFKSGLFVEIKSNQINKFVPFFNLNFKNNWSKLINTKDILLNKNVCKDTTKWSCFNCIIKTKDLNETEDTFYSEFKHMLETTLERHHIKDCSFFMNRKDFPILTKKGIEPYHHIFGENVPLTSYKFDEYAPILSPTKRLDIFADVLIPTDNCWQITTQKVFPSRCQHKYIDNELNQEIRGVKWEEKIETAVWRGHSTGCAVDFRNPRLLITKINEEWKNDIKLKDYLNAGVIGQAYKLKKYKDSSELKRINLKELGITLVEPMDMKEQMKYKYILDIEGNAAAYRLGYILSFKSLLLKVKSEYKMWIDDFMKPNIHYIPIHKDFSNLATTIEWCRNNDDKCKEIAENAYKLFKQCFTEKFICKYFSKKLNNMKTLKIR